ncbi:MAG: prepilin peptidase [Patescibacteria group bacterium]
MLFVYILIFIFGLIIGSFLNVVVFRLKNNKGFVIGRSHCDNCKHILPWHENIPLVSFAFLGGKCSSCKQKISWQYPLVELATGLLFLTASIIIFRQNLLLYYSITLLLYYFITISFLIIIFIYDLKYYLILDKVSIPAVIFVLIFKLFISWPFLSDYWLLGLSAIIGGGWFALQFYISKGKWVGGGDIRLGILMGLILGWPGILLALGLSYVGGTVILLPFVLLKKKGMKSQVPFGAFLVPATIIIMFWGGKIINWYLNKLF